MDSNEISNLAFFFKKFTGTGNKQSQRMAHQVLEFDEIIIALSATIEETLTANFIDENLSSKIKVSHLANGVPVGASIEYIDKLTFTHAFKNRKESK